GVREAFTRAGEQKQAFDFEHRLLLPDGALKHVRIVAHPATERKDRQQFVGALMDVTTRQQDYERLEQSEHRYRYLFNHMPIALFQLDSSRLVPIFQELRTAGMTDLAAEFREQPDLLQRMLDALTVIDVNDTALRMMGAKDRSELLGPAAHYWRE